MSYQVIPSDSTRGNSHSSLYESNHRDYHFSLLPFSEPIPLFTISNGNPLWDSISSFKALWGVYQMSKSTYFVKDRWRRKWGERKLRGLRRRGLFIKKSRRKSKQKRLKRLMQRKNFSSNQLLIFMNAKVQSMKFKSEVKEVYGQYLYQRGG